jgi:hypothetical protein
MTYGRPISGHVQIARGPDSPGGGPGPGSPQGAGESRQSKDSFQKYVLDRNLAAALESLGFGPDDAARAEVLTVEVARPNVSSRRPDYVLKMPNGSILVIEFQSTWNRFILVRFLEYASLLSVSYSLKWKKFVPVTTMVVFPAGIKRESVDLSFPGKTEEDGPAGEMNDGPAKTLKLPVNGSLRFDLLPVFLAEHIDVPNFIQELWNPQTGLNTDAYPDLRPPNALLGKAYLLPIAAGPVVSLEFVKNYLGLGLAMALKASDPDILLTMIFGALTLDTAATDTSDSAVADVFANFLEELSTMGLDFNETKMADRITGGKFSMLQKSLMSKDEQIKSKDEQIKSKDEQLMSKDEQIKSQGEQLMSKDEQIKSQGEQIKSLIEQLKAKNGQAE